MSVAETAVLCRNPAGIGFRTIEDGTGVPRDTLSRCVQNPFYIIRCSTFIAVDSKLLSIKKRRK